MNSKYRIKKSTAEKVKLMFTYALLILMAAIMLVPFLWMLSASLKLEKDVFSYPIVWIPRDPQWQNYVEIWKKVPLLTGFFNTTKLTVCTVVLQLLTSSLAAYAFAKLEFKGRDTIFMIYVMTISIPWQVYMVPQYKMMTLFGLTNSHIGIILMHAFTATGVFMMRQFFMGVPKELNEAAAIDGAGPIRTFISIMLPMAKSTLASLAIIVFTYSWNDYFTTFIMINDTEKLTLPVGILSIKQPFSTGDNVVFAAVVLAILPVLIVFLIGQKWIVKSMTHVGVKG